VKSFTEGQLVWVRRNTHRWCKWERATYVGLEPDKGHWVRLHDDAELIKVEFNGKTSTWRILGVPDSRIKLVSKPNKINRRELEDPG